MKETQKRTGKAPRRNGGESNARYPGWAIAYFVLAAFGIVTVAGSLGLHYRLAAIHAESMTESRQWATRLESFQELEVLIASINAPGNGIFQTGDVARERKRQKAVTEDFRNRIARIRKLLRSDLEEVQNQSLFVLLDALDRTAGDTIGFSGLFFDSFESGDVATAGRHLANMDQEYARLISLMTRIEEESHGFLRATFDRQETLAREMRNVEILIAILIAILIVVMVPGVAVYGGLLSRRMVARAPRRQAQLDLLEASELRFQELAEGSIQGIVVHRDDERLFANQTWANMHGFSGADFSELPLAPSELVAPKDRERVQDIRHALQNGNGETRRYEYRALRRDASTPWLECLERVVQWRDRPALQSTVIDISERKKAEEDLRDALMQLEHAASARMKFFAAASHDLRQPLHAMSLYLPLLEKRVSHTANRDFVQAIKRSCDSMRDFLDSLLDISKLDAGVVEPEIVPVSANELIRNLATEFAPRAAARNLDFRAVIPAGRLVDSDPVLLQQILRNLLSNAVRYTSHGRILFCARQRGDMLRFEVWDTGIGIRESDLEVIFEEFYQAENPERDRGLGLGLAINKRLAKLLGHRIWQRSKPDKGSVFFVEAPLSAQPVAVDHAPAAVAGAEHGMDGVLVVLVDDDTTILEGMQAMLEEWGCDVITAESALQAVDRIAGDTRRPDIALVDFRLGNNETGIQAIARIREVAGIHVPAIVITADTDPARIRQATEIGCTLMHKPINPAKLKETMLQTLSESPRNYIVYKQLVKTSP